MDEKDQEKDGEAKDPVLFDEGDLFAGLLILSEITVVDVLLGASEPG